MRLWKLALRTLLRRPLRSGLTVMGLAVGIGALVALLGLAQGLRQGWAEVYRSRGVDLVVVNGRDADLLQSRVPEGVVEELNRHAAVRVASGVLVDLTSYEGVANTFITGRSPDGLTRAGLEIVQGRGLSPLPRLPPLIAWRPPTEEDLSSPPPPLHPAEREILLGSAFASGHGKRPGDTVLVEEEPFHVVGVYRGSSLLENGGAIVHLRALQRFTLREAELSSVEVRLQSPEGYDEVTAWLRERHPELLCQRPAELLERSFGLQIVEAMAWAVSVLALAVGLVGTSNTMLMSVMEQRRQFGLLRSLGWRRARIQILVLLETLFLSAGAYALGCVLGLGGTRLLQELESLRFVLEARLDLAVVGRALTVTLALSVAAAAYPALRAARISPIEALHLP